MEAPPTKYPWWESPNFFVWAQFINNQNNICFTSSHHMDYRITRAYILRCLNDSWVKEYCYVQYYCVQSVWIQLTNHLAIIQMAKVALPQAASAEYFIPKQVIPKTKKDQMSNLPHNDDELVSCINIKLITLPQIQINWLRTLVSPTKSNPHWISITIPPSLHFH